jgi:hypothetical protein
MSEEHTTNPLEDFEEFFLDECITHEFTLPNGKPMLYKGKQVIGKVYSPGSETYVQAKAELDREATKRVMQSVAKTAAKKDEVSSQDSDAQFMAKLVKLENFPFPGGEYAVFKTPRLKYMADDIRLLLGNLGNFFESGKKA